MKKLTAVWVEKARYTPIKSKGGKNPGVLLGNRIPDPEYPGHYLHISYQKISGRWYDLESLRAVGSASTTTDRRAAHGPEFPERERREVNLAALALFPRFRDTGSTLQMA
jgi:hypothetical protein